MIRIFKTEPSEVVGIECPFCKERVARVKLKRNSVIHGLTIKCKRCGELLEVEATI